MRWTKYWSFSFSIIQLTNQLLDITHLLGGLGGRRDGRNKVLGGFLRSLPSAFVNIFQIKSREHFLEVPDNDSELLPTDPITSWQIEGEKIEIATDFIFLGSKITADGDCSHEIKRPFLLGSKAMANPDSILQSRDITLPTRIHQSKL